MAILGFIFICLVMLYVGLLLCLSALNGLGEYTIGGAKNSNLGRVFIIVFIIAYFYAWGLVFEHSPFTLTIS